MLESNPKCKGNIIKKILRKEMLEVFPCLNQKKGWNNINVVPSFSIII